MPIIQWCDNAACGRLRQPDEGRAWAQGRCPTCYQYWRTHDGRDRPWGWDGRAHGADRRCTVPECDRPHKALGYCARHYGRRATLRAAAREQARAAREATLARSAPLCLWCRYCGRRLVGATCPAGCTPRASRSL